MNRDQIGSDETSWSGCTLNNESILEMKIEISLWNTVPLDMFVCKSKSKKEGRDQE